MKEEKEKMIEISFPAGTFIFFVYADDDEILYIGYTEDINKKSFNFPFEYKSIKGFYYTFPDIEEQVDSLIMKYRPRYNKTLRSYIKLTSARKFINEKLEKRGFRHITVPYLKKIIQSIEAETITINGVVYMTKGEASYIAEYLMGE